MVADTTDVLLATEEVLREEVRVIHGEEKAKTLEGKTGVALYRELNELNSAALCLSGGGIRSASFALGVIQALAVHPRPISDKGPDNKEKEMPVERAGDSLLARFHYLSTVSGGGYIGSWLSAGIARTSFDTIWRKLVHREPRPDDEAAQITWLRTYSNYLTPKLGVTSADTWTAVALYGRNLILNWLVFAPVLCAALIVIKLIAVGSFALRPIPWLGVGLLFAIGALFHIWALRFTLLNRPTRPAGSNDATTRSTGGNTIARNRNYGAQLRDERKQARRGVPTALFVRQDLLFSLLAAFVFMLAFLPDATDPLLERDLWELAAGGFGLGFLIYAISWIAAWPWPRCDGERGRLYWLKDFVCWAIAGGVYGAIIGWGVNLFTFDLTPLLGGIEVRDITSDTLLLLIYGVPWVISAQLTAEMVFVGLTSRQADADADREWFGRSTGWFAVTALVWLFVAFLVLIGADLVFSLYAKVGSYFGKTTGGVVSAIAGAVTAILGKSSATPARGQASGSLWTSVALVVAATIFLIALVVGFSAVLDNLLLDYSLLHSPLLGGPPPTGIALFPSEDDAPPTRGEDLMWLLIGLAVVLSVWRIASRNVNVNRFSLHALYRNRLIRAFLGATNPKRNPDTFTGFDERDNPPVACIRPHGEFPRRLFHVINIALNVVSSRRLAWQERKAESFTVSPTHCGTACGREDKATGCPQGSYRPSEDYGNSLSLGTAMAISGAAASPNMGYHSSPLVTILLALFNVRLGWWLGNPGLQGKDTYTSEGPTRATKPLFDEMLGRTTDENSYVYLSDGGHFENLGLYEMVRRRCRFIVVSDAGCDPNFTFEDLGNALRKIEIDLGIKIAMSKLELLRKRGTHFENGPNHPYCAFGEIDYRSADHGGANGFLLYIKPCYHGVEGAGIRAYATANSSFPHQTTGDQFFSESQFESYRALGFEIMDELLKKTTFKPAQPPALSLDEITGALRNRIKEIAESMPASSVHFARVETIQ